ncbi:hypothetical protein BT69DRAFT_783053 [Atractiella rhizophila]|nr:hypothetical protein BT69DRAFT_783053 [Atractiella rhizophila]
MLLATFRAKAVSLNPTDWKRAHESFAEYLKSEGALVWKNPEGVSSSFEEAAAIGGSSQHTTFMMMFLLVRRLQNLAEPAGLKVVTTVSRVNHQLLKGYGADACYDYDDPEVVSRIEKDWPNIHYGIDNICQAPSSLLAAQHFNDLTGGHSSYDVICSHL